MNNDLIGIGYLRKSDEDKHGQVQSIAKQREWIEKEARLAGEKIQYFFEDTQSAKKPGREGFLRMMDFIENTDNAIKLYTWKTSRLARNGIDEGAIKYAISRGKIKQIITRDRRYDESTNHILLGVDFGEATQFSIDLSKDVKEGMQQKVSKGYRPTGIPNGWLPDRAGIKGERRILVDEQRFPILQKELRKILDSKGSYRVADSLRYLRSIGFKTRTGTLISKGTLHGLFSNPFISGKYPWGGGWETGKHKRMITPYEFDQLQIYISGKRSTQRKHNNLYNGLIRCNDCDCWITTEPPKIKKQQNGNVHIYNYMRCTKSKGKCPQKYIRVEKVEERIAEVMADIELDYDWVQYAVDVLQREAAEHKDTSKQKEQLQKQLNESQKMLLGLTQKYALGKIDESIYQELLSQEKQKQEDLLSQKERLMGKNSSPLNSLCEDMNLAHRIAKAYKEAEPEDRKRIISELQSNLWLIDGKLLIDLRASFLVISQVNRLKPIIEPSKSPSRRRKSCTCKNEVWSGAPSRTQIELLKSHLKVRKFYEEVVLPS